jgi:hypothetical protein
MSADFDDATPPDPRRLASSPDVMEYRVSLCEGKLLTGARTFASLRLRIWGLVGSMVAAAVTVIWQARGVADQVETTRAAQVEMQGDLKALTVKVGNLATEQVRIDAALQQRAAEVAQPKADVFGRRNPR